MRPVQLMFAPLRDGDGWRTLSAMASLRGPSRLLVLPGALVLARDVSPAGRTEAQARAAALAALAPELAMQPDTCVCALGPPRDGKRLAFVVARDVLDRNVSVAKSKGFAPDAILPDYALLPEPLGSEAVVATGVECAVRLPGAGFGCSPELLPVLLGDYPQRTVDFDSTARATIAGAGFASLPTLEAASGAAARADRSALPALAIASLAAALAIYATLPWIEVAQLNAATAELRRETERVARAALPEAQRIVNPLAQLREARMPAASAAAGLEQAATLLEGLSRSPGVSIARLELVDGAMHAQVGVSSTSLLQPMRDHAAASGYQLVETPGPSQPNSIPVDLQLATAP